MRRYPLLIVLLLSACDTTDKLSPNLSPGTSCTDNQQCSTRVCSGRCCNAGCASTDMYCGGVGRTCDDTGACNLPVAGTLCGPTATSCTGNVITKNACNGAGSCVTTTSPCPASTTCAFDGVEWTCAPNGGTTGGSTSGGTSGGTTSGGSTTGGTTTGGSTTGGTTTGGTTTGGSTTGGGTLPAGSTCTGNAQCTSGVCGVNGSGNCCAAACSTSDPKCGATGCDSTNGLCTFPPATTSCGNACTGSSLTQSLCNGAGTCVAGTPAPCPNHFGCNSGGTCNTTCGGQFSDCATDYYCVSNQCVPKLLTGACNGPNDCHSGICGTIGFGHCCTAACDATGDAKCHASDCDNATGACAYPDSLTACGKASCNGATFTPASTCDGTGQCQPPVTSDCSPYVCGANACLTSCKSTTSCVAGDFCDTKNTTCCSGLANGGTLYVDGSTGSDATPCCGIDPKLPCQTLTQAMVLIDAAQVQDVTIAATVNGGGGDWTSNETYPVVLGWGVELNAPGVFFLDPTSITTHNLETFDVGPYSKSDTVGYASIVGSANSPVGVGMDSANSQQTADNYAIAVESGTTLDIANASVNGSYLNGSWALYVAPTATLLLGQDHSGGVTGTVTIGNALGQDATDGYLGIWCDSDQVSVGCTIQDAPLVGQSSVVIEGQRDEDIDAEFFGTISLTSNPVIGVAPSAVGFGNCPQKHDAVNSYAVIISGQVSFTLKNGTVQCIAGTAFFVGGASGNGPSLTMDNTIIQNTDVGIDCTSGTATFTNTTFNYNYIGVWQGFEATLNGAIDLSGGGNSVICSDSKEASHSFGIPGMDVYNTSTANLNATNVAWDTASPDYFDCDVNFVCSCNLGSCSTAAGSDDMDAVEDSTAKGGITTTNGSQSPNACN